MSELVTDYMEGALSLPRRLAARLHLTQCAACRHYFDQMRRTVQLLRQGGPNGPGPGVEEGLLQAMSKKDDSTSQS